MFLNLYWVATIFSYSNYIPRCFCYVNYDQFQGFANNYDISQDEVSSPVTLSPHSTHNLMSSTVKIKIAREEATPSTPAATTADQTTSSTTRPSVSTIYPKFNCSEDEHPFNIGSYEVPTQRDLVLQIQRTLKRMFDLYQEKALDLLQDIQQATKATSSIEQKCMSSHHSHRPNYKKCVKEVSRKCEYITKSLVASLERQRADVAAFMNGTICNVTEMRADPVQLIKTLAMEQAALEFALPGFLRLLGSCSAHCNKTHKLRHKKPLRHMTDQDLVVKHFLTRKTYAQLINNNK